MFILFTLVFVPDLSAFKTGEQNERCLPDRNSVAL